MKNQTVLLIAFVACFFISSVLSASAIDVASCRIIDANGTWDLTAATASNGTCFQINVSNVSLNCHGFRVRYDLYGNSTAALPVAAVNVSDAFNVTIRDCLFQDGNASDAHSYGVHFVNVTNSTILNNTLETNGSNNAIGIRLMGNSSHVVIDSNTILTNGTAGDNYGVFANGGSVGVRILNNRINTSGTVDNYGVNLENGVFNATVSNVTIHVFGTSTGNAGVNIENGTQDINVSNSNLSVRSQGGSGFGIRMNSSVLRTLIHNNNLMAGADSQGGSHIGLHARGDVSGSIVQDNNINTSGTTNNLGIGLNESPVVNNSFLRNTISTRGTSGASSIFLDDGASGGPLNNTFTGNLLRVPVGAHGIQLIGARMTTFIATTINGSVGTAGTYAVHLTATNDTLFNSTLINEPHAWMYASGEAASLALQTNMTNTTFLTRNGSLNYNGTVQVNNGTDLTYAKLNVSQNLVFVNVSSGANMTTFNTSALIALYNLTPSVVRVQVDSESDGTFTDCSLTQCPRGSYVLGNFTFNVTSFSAYRTIGNYSCGDLAENATLNMELNSSLTCFNIRTSHLVLDCAGFAIRYDKDGGSAVGAPSMAINLSGVSNVTVRNCIFQDANSSGAHGYAVNLFNVSNSTIDNNTIRTNGSTDNYGVRITARSRNNTVSNNTILTRGTGVDNFGVYLNASWDNLLINNTITTDFGGSSGFVLIADAKNNVLQSNNVSANQSFALNISLSNLTHLVNQRIDNYSIVDSDLVVNLTSFGKLQLLTNTTVRGQNLSSDIQIENHRFLVNSTNTLGLNQTTQITFINVTFSTPKVQFSSNGTDPFFTDCVSPQCVQWGSFGNRTSKFNVTQWSVYRLVETVADVPVVRGGSSGGGGGGGSGSAVGGKYTIILASATSTMQTVHNRAEYKYRVGGVDAKLFVADVTRDHAVLDLSPDMKRRTVRSGDVFKQDVNSDGVYDLAIEVVSTSLADAKLKFKLISEAVPASERVVAPAPAPTTVVKKQAEPSVPSKAAAQTASAPSAPANDASSSQQQQAVKASAPAKSGNGLTGGAFSDVGDVQKSSSSALLVSLFVLALVGVGAYWYLQKK